MNEDLTEPVRIAGEPLFGVDESQEDGATGGDARSRWPWLAGFGALALLALSGVLWMLASVPNPAPRAPGGAGGTPATSAPSPTTGLSTADPTRTVSPWPTVSAAGRVSTPTFRTTPATTLLPPPTRPSPAPTRTTSPPPPRPAAVRVPNVVGLRQATATSILRAAGFQVSAVPVAFVGPGGVRRVIAQNPTGGSTAAYGSVVTIFVSGGN